MNQEKELNIALKYAEIDNKPYSEEHEGWVSCLVNILKQTIEFYFQRAVQVHLKTETELINEREFESLDAVIYILSPAFFLSSNIRTEVSAIEKAVLFNTEYINSKVHKVLKGPVNINELPMSISMGTFHYFYQTGSSGDSTYETLFHWDNSPLIRNKYWESFTNLLLDLLKGMNHSRKKGFTPAYEQTVFLGAGDIEQLWNRTNLLGELNARGVKVLPDQDYSIEVKHLNEPIKFYLKKSDFAIHFPEEFLPLEKNKIDDLADLSWLKRYIWFDPEQEKDLEKKKHYDELKQKLKNLEHIEAISSGLEELKEILFAAHQKEGIEQEEEEKEPILYLIFSASFRESIKNEVCRILSSFPLKLLFLDQEKAHERRAKHYRYLKESDFCLICYDGQNPEWIQANVNEVKKSVGLNPEKKRKIKLGVIAATDEVLKNLEFYSKGLTLVSAQSASLQEDLNEYVHGK